MQNVLEVGEKYTLYGVSDFMASTTRNELKISQFIDGRPVFKQRGKGNRTGNKQFYLKLNGEMLLFKGWREDIPFKLQQEVGVDSGRGYQTQTFTGNAMLNFVGDAGEIKTYIEENNLNKAFVRHDSVLVWNEDEYKVKGMESSTVLLYPDSPTSSAIVDNLRIKQSSGV